MITEELLKSKSAEEVIKELPTKTEYCHVGAYSLNGMTYCGIVRATIPTPEHKGWTTANVPNFCPVCGRKTCPKCVELA